MKLSNKILIIGLAVVLGGMLFVAAGTRIMIGKAVKQGNIGFEKADLGERVSKTYNYTDFNELAASGVWDIRITQGTKYAVVLKMEEGLTDQVLVAKNGPIVSLSMKDDFYVVGNKPISVELVMPELTGISLQGGANVIITGFSSERFVLDSEGASNIVGKDNEIENLFLSCDGAAHVNLKSSQTVNADVNLAGASNVVLTMNGGILKGKIDGIGSLEYYGKVAEEKVLKHGISSIQKH